MAATKQVYTLDANWTAATLAITFRSAFIDAGLMTEWFDSFLSGTVENRILRVVHDATKTYGTTFYWFMFTTTGVSTHVALSWDATSHVPTGTYREDYFASTTNATTYHYGLITDRATTTSATLTRYTSGINTSCTWFMFLQSGNQYRFLIPHGAYTANSFVNLNVNAFNGTTSITSGTSSYGSQIFFYQLGGITRRVLLGSSILRDSGTTSHYIPTWRTNAYATGGNVSGGGVASNNIPTTTPITYLPTAFANTNTSLAADYSPVYTSIAISPYLPVMPADFALAPYYASNAIGTGDTFVVSPGLEEYDVFYVQLASSSTTVGAGHLLFLIRTVG